MNAHHPQYEDHIAAVNKTLKELGAEDKPTLMVFNKIDLYREKNYDELLEEEAKQEIEVSIQENLKNNYAHDTIVISAISGENIPELRERMKAMIRKQYNVRYPYMAKRW